MIVWIVFFQKHTIARLLASIFLLFPQKRKKVDAVVCFRTGKMKRQKKNLLLLLWLLWCLFVGTVGKRVRYK